MDPTREPRQKLLFLGMTADFIYAFFWGAVVTGVIFAFYLLTRYCFDAPFHGRYCKVWPP